MSSGAGGVDSDYRKIVENLTENGKTDLKETLIRIKKDGQVVFESKYNPLARFRRFCDWRGEYKLSGENLTRVTNNLMVLTVKPENFQTAIETKARQEEDLVTKEDLTPTEKKRLDNKMIELQQSFGNAASRINAIFKKNLGESIELISQEEIIFEARPDSAQLEGEKTLETKSRSYSVPIIKGASFFSDTVLLHGDARKFVEAFGEIEKKDAKAVGLLKESIETNTKMSDSRRRELIDAFIEDGLRNLPEDASTKNIIAFQKEIAGIFNCEPSVLHTNPQLRAFLQARKESIENAKSELKKCLEDKEQSIEDVLRMFDHFEKLEPHAGVKVIEDIFKNDETWGKMNAACSKLSVTDVIPEEYKSSRDLKLLQTFVQRAIAHNSHETIEDRAKNISALREIMTSFNCCSFLVLNNSGIDNDNQEYDYYEDMLHLMTVENYSTDRMISNAKIANTKAEVNIRRFIMVQADLLTELRSLESGNFRESKLNAFEYKYTITYTGPKEEFKRLVEKHNESVTKIIKQARDQK